ncbi:MAG: metalloregulator ArsR/SmtB family transcription factor [Pseudomonadota bacterium]
MNEPEALAAFASLSNPTRLRMLKALVVAGPDGMNAGDIAEAVEATPSRASFHLSTMAEAGLVTSSRRAREITYRVDFKAVGALVQYLMHDCCGGNAIVRACCGDGEGC